MGYKIQTNRQRPITEENWVSRKKLGDDLFMTDVDLDLNPEQAVRCIRFDANLSRIIYPMRAINEVGHVIATYEPEDDTRLPGCRQRAIWRLAEKLCNRSECVGEKFWYDWEVGGRQDGSLVEFVVEAEKQLPDNDGFWCDPAYQNVLRKQADTWVEPICEASILSNEEC